VLIQVCRQRAKKVNMLSMLPKHKSAGVCGSKDSCNFVAAKPVIYRKKAGQHTLFYRRGFWKTVPVFLADI
jgi:hypothetical protein